MLRTKRELLTNLIVDQNPTRDEVRSIISELNYAENGEEHFISYYSNKIKGIRIYN